MLIADDLVINPKEAPVTPARTERSLSQLGLSVLSVDWGDSLATDTATRTITVELDVRGDGSADLPTAAHELQQLVGSMQERETWIRRDHIVGGKFEGPVMYRIKASPEGSRPEVTLSNLGGWQAGDSPEVTLTIVAEKTAFSTTETLLGTVPTATANYLTYAVAAGDGSARGLRRTTVENKNSSGDWRGLLWAEECWDYSGAPTAAPAYEATKLTPKGGAEISAAIAPEVRAVGAVAAGEGTVAPGLPAGTIAGDLLIMVAESKGTDPALTAEGWTAAPKSSQVQGNTRLTVLYKIAAGGDATTTNDTGDHQLARIIGIKAGTFDPAEPFNFFSAGGTQTATKAVTIPGGLTGRDNCLVLACASGNLPDATTTAEFSAVTNASLTGLTERIDNTTASGDGGAIFAATGVKATKGILSATTVTAVTEAERGVISLAVNAKPEFLQHTALTTGWATILGTQVIGSGHMTHRGGRRPWVRAMDPGSTPGNVQLRLVWRVLGSARWREENAIATLTAVGNYMWLDLDSVRPQAAALGEERWEGKLLARATTGSGAVRLHLFCPLPTEQYILLQDTEETPIDGEPASTGVTVENATGIGSIAWKAKGGGGTMSFTGEANYPLFSGTGQSNYLKVTNFGFGGLIPEGATILGVIARAVPLSVTGASIEEKRIRLVVEGVIKEAEDKAGTGGPTIWNSPETRSWGGVHDLWGLGTISRTQVIATNFGIVLALGNSVLPEAPGQAITFKRVEMVVAYAEGSNENRICFASRSVDLRSDGAYRQHVTDEVWGRIPEIGFLPYGPPGGLEGRTIRGIVIPTQGDFENRPDLGSNKASLSVYDRSGHHISRGSA